MMKWKFQFSLSSLLWLTVCLALLLTSILMYRRMVRAEAELPVLRRAAGYLAVGDEKLVYGRTVKTYEPNNWKWRLFLPAGHHFVVKVATGIIPQSGIPDIETQECPININGELALTVDIHQFENNAWMMTMNYKDEILDFDRGIYYSAKSLDYSVSIPVSASVMEKFTQARGYQSSCFGSSEIDNIAPDKPIDLLRARLGKMNSNGGWTSSDDPEPGILIWLEEQK
jgi:hypothetical protein